jgi:NodT family efflux transporter outer membrane factor (OMF) lipoprotein
VFGKREGLFLACAAVVAAAPLVGCATHEPGFETPVTPPAAFVENDSAFSRATPDRWWEAFDDPALDALQVRALDVNFDLEAARERWRAARAVVRRERSLLLPTFDYFAFGEQTRLESEDFEEEERFGLGARGSYQLDVWRENENLVESAALAAAVEAERVKAAAIALSADVALTWYALVEQRGQAAVLEEQIRTNEQVLRVVRARFGGGVVRASDVLRQERLLESTREQRAAVRASIETLEHALLVLIGRPPTEGVDAALDELPVAPPRPALGLPSELAQRRPDVRAALLSIASADAAVAAAVARQYPSVTLGIEASTVEDSIGDLLDDWASVISVDVLGPLFDGGRREAEVERTKAIKAERVNLYAQTVLVALREVVDAISREDAREEQIWRLERQLELARRTSERLNREYLNGDISYIDVLEALTTEQQLQRDLLAARFDRIGDRIDLYRALAGGWEGVLDAGDEAFASGGEG